MTDLVKIGDVSNYRKEFFEITDSKEYKRCRVQLHKKGVVLRDILKGNDIKTKQQRLCKKNDFIVAEMDAKFGGYGIIPETLDSAIVSSHYYLFGLKEDKILPEFFEVLIDTDIIQLQIKAKGSTNYSRVSPKEVMEFEIPCPSIEFQQQVVKKYSNSKIDIIKLLNEANYQLNLLKQLRQAILQEAVEGKLTAEWRKQNPELISGENHAARLLEKIKAEKERLIKEGKISRQKALPPIREDEKPFELPDGWVWCRLGNLGIINRGKGPIYSDSGEHIILNQKCIKWFKIKSEYAKKVSNEWYDTLTVEARTEKGDILVNSTGEGTIGRSAVVDTKSIGYIFDSHILRFRSSIKAEYSSYLINSSLGQIQVENLKGAKSTKQTELGVENLNSFLFSLPPLDEQQAIVKKVDRLMANIDALEEQVKSRKEQTAQLMQAVLREAFNGA